MTQLMDAVLERAIERGEVAGVTAVAVDRGGTLYEGAFGRQRVADCIEMRTNVLFQIASMTKAPVSVAALQLVQRGLLSLDDPAATVLPQLAAVPVLGDDGMLRLPTRPVTLRHLLTHTSGFGYPFTSTRLARYVATTGARTADTPLLFEPGEQWQYGVSTDWVGRMVAAASGLPLDTYLQQHVFTPLRMTDTGYEILGDGESQLASTHQRQPDGTLQEAAFVVPPVRVRGGAGLISTAPDYARFLRMILRGGELDGAQVIDTPCVGALSTNQIGDLVAGRWSTAVSQQSNDTDFSDGGTARWSLGFLVGQRATASGRSAGSLSWGGLLNTYYWIDPAAGIAGVILMQVLPFADAICLRIRDEFERAVYATFRPGTL